MNWLERYQEARKNKCILFYHPGDIQRVLEDEPSKGYIEFPERNPFWKDYQRLISSPSFRRLKGKTQLFPGNESDFFRCRLTHSLEVAHIGKSITLRLNELLKESYGKDKEPCDPYFSFIDPDLVQFACLAHDIGHPPFGHQGEEELNIHMHDTGGFEGNAQTLRIISKLEKKFYRQNQDDFDLYPTGFSSQGFDYRVGLNLTYRSLASILKYDHLIVKNVGLPVQKGFYELESNLVEDIKNNVIHKRVIDQRFKTVECQIMDIADDIAYSVYDLEDSFKGGFISLTDLLNPKENLLNEIAKRLNDKNRQNYFWLTSEIVDEILSDGFQDFEDYLDTDIADGDDSGDDVSELFYSISNNIHDYAKSYAKNGYRRTDFFSRLVGSFINKINIKIDKDNPCLSKVYFKEERPSDYIHKTSKTQLFIEILKIFTYEFQIQAPRLKIVEYRGKEIVREIFEAIHRTNGVFLADDKRIIYNLIDRNTSLSMEEQEILKRRIICDFISGMTDKYAFDYYSRLKSESAQSIFKEM